MKKLIMMCLVCTCCMASLVFADVGTVANAPGALSIQSISQDEAYVLQAKEAGTLDLNDPAYLRVVEYYAMKAAPAREADALDQGNDNCPATIIPSLPYSDAGSTTALVSDFSCAGNTSGDVVYQYTATTAGVHVVQTCGGTTNYDTRLEVRTGVCPGAPNLCNDDACGLQSIINVNLNIGDVITIVVDGYSSAFNEGNYTLTVTGPAVCLVDGNLVAPGSISGNTCGAGDDCSLIATEDHVYSIVIPTSGSWQIQLCDESVAFWDSYMYLGTYCCGSDVYSQDDGGCGPNNFYLTRFPCLTLTAGTYYVTIEGLYSGQCGGYTLSVTECIVGRCCFGSSCQDGYLQSDCEFNGGVYGGNFSTCASNPCPPPPPPPGALRVINVPVPGSVGVCIAADCFGDLYYTNLGSNILHKMDEFGNLISSTPIMDAAGNAIFVDEMSWDEGRQLFWGGAGSPAVYQITTGGLATFQFNGMVGIPLTDGIAFDPTDGTVWHTTDVSATIEHYSAAGLFLGALTPLDENGNPEPGISGVVVGAANTLWAGNSPIDDVRRVDKTTGAFVSRFDAGQVRCEGMECDAINFAPQTVLWVKDAYNNTVTAFEIEAGTCVCAQLPDTCQFPYQEIDDGDLTPCDYPTFHANPGHGLSGVAWLGAGITGEGAPNSLNFDPADDGVGSADFPWVPCTIVDLTVLVTAGPNYGRFAECNGHLYLSAWKDGNLDGDFCDEIPCGPVFASEWIVQDEPVTPGLWSFDVLDPGVLDIGVYDGWIRVRLTSQPVGRYGHGLNVAGACNFECPGTYGLDFLGEVEDYIVDDLQLSAELGTFAAVPGSNSITLVWNTLSETDNDRFEIMRDDVLVQNIISGGNTASGHNYEWTDEQLTNGRTYEYTLVAVDLSGMRAILGTIEATPNAGAATVTEYALHQNFPNPFNPETQISFDLIEAGNVTLKVYNLMGQEVAMLVNGTMNAGRHNVNFNAAGLASGLYLYKIEVNGFSAQKKMMLMK